MKTLTYKGYVGSIEISDEDNCLFGKVLDLPKDTAISYEGETVADLKEDFKGAVDDYIAFFRVGKRADRLHHSHTAACAVPRVFVQMTAPKAVRAMVSRCVAQRFNGFAAVSADKSAVVFRKAFLFHYSSQKV